MTSSLKGYLLDLIRYYDSNYFVRCVPEDEKKELKPFLLMKSSKTLLVQFYLK